MTGFLQDLRFVLRTIVRHPMLVALAALTLAVGIGATTAIFSLAEAVIFRPLRLTESQRLVSLYSFHRERGFDRSNVSYPDFAEWRVERDLFESAALHRTESVDLSGEGDPERILIAVVGDEFFETLRATPLVGRVLGSDDHEVDAEPTVVLYEGLWKRRFGADPGIVGQTVRLDGDLYTVVGVIGDDSRWPLRAVAWTSLRFGDTPPAWTDRRSNHMWNVSARLADGATVESASARVSSIARTSASAVEEERERGWDAAAMSLLYVVAEPELRIAFAVFLIAVSFVLLIACINVSNLLLARASTRAHELAVRSALGAGRRRLVRLLLGESLVFALLGGALGTALSFVVVKNLVTLAPAGLPRVSDVSPNLTVLGFALLASLVASVIAGLVPALHASRPDVAGTLKEGARSTGMVGKRTRSALVAAELALSMILLAGAGLAIRSFHLLLNVDPGYSVENRLVYHVSLPPARYPDDDRVSLYFDEAVDRLLELPGVRSAAITKTLPLGGGGSQLFRSFVVEGEPDPPTGPAHPAMWYEMSVGLFEALGSQMAAGRNFSDADNAGSVPVIIVNEAMAKQLPADAPVLGMQIRSFYDENLNREIVGIASDLAYGNLARSSQPAVFVPAAQSPRRTMGFVVRTDGNPAAMLPAVRTTMRTLDPDIALAGVATLEQVRDRSLAGVRFVTLLLGLFGSLALILATVGVYGLMSYSVSQRTHELGLRMALGAQSGHVRSMVLGEAVKIAGLGLGIGLLGGLAMGYGLSRVLFGISPFDPLALGGTAAILGGSALLASYIPARRATRVDPMVALRCE